MDILERLVTLGTQDTQRRQTNEKKHHTENKNGEQHGPNQNKTGGEPRCSLTTQT